MRNLTNEEIEFVSGGGDYGGGGGDSKNIAIGNVSLLNGNCISVGDVLSGNLSGNSVLSGNDLTVVLKDLLNIL